MGLVEDGAMAVRGNHDNAIGTPSESMNAEAQAAIEWTRGRLSAPQRRFLAELPMTLQEDDRLYVHSEASHPARWRYVSNAGRRAQHRGDRCPCHLLRTHPPAGALFDVGGGEDDELRPDIRRAGAIAGGRRWLAVLGSVGQPRDGNPAAAFAMLDTVSREITYCRVPYDVEAAAERIRDNGLPHWLADRLLVGR